jgi:hypothetical protein
VGLAVILGIVGLQILDDSGNGSSSDAVTTTVLGATTGVATTGVTGTTAGSTSRPTTTTAPARPAAQVRVKVYNASGVQGRAQTLTDKLKAKGYNMQTAANLDKQRKGTVVECVKGFAREAAVLAQFGVESGAVTAAYPSSPPPGASDADCIVIIGTA